MLRPPYLHANACVYRIPAFAGMTIVPGMSTVHVEPAPLLKQVMHLSPSPGGTKRKAAALTRSRPRSLEVPRG
jgi:hypothetical protein